LDAFNREAKMTKYLHNSINLHLIAKAAKDNDLDRALLPIMDANDIRTGDNAAQFFSGTSWNCSISEREQLLRDWLYYELNARA
jgi:hypothetical protein